MKINKITIQHVKGIEQLEILQPLVANRPNILVAPNGFGKSSIATAFSSLKPNKLELTPDNCYNQDQRLSSSVSILLDDNQTLTANSTSNTIKNVFAVHVVNCQLKPKAFAQNRGKFHVAKASLDISDTIIYKSIPQKIEISYSFRNFKNAYGGVLGKIITKIEDMFSQYDLLCKIDKKIQFHKFELKQYQKAFDVWETKIQTFNQKKVIELKQAILDSNYELEHEEFKKLAVLLKDALQYDNFIDAICAAVQYIDTRLNCGQAVYSKAITYLKYIKQRKQLDDTLSEINPVKERFSVRAKEKKGQLVIEWPKANMISSGQRDILVFIAKLMECEFHEHKNCILIIDEFFDYLDDANIIAFQYYISNLIDSYKRDKRVIFPILLTHLDPNYLKHFCFNDKRMNVCYLKSSNAKCSPMLMKFVKERETESIKDYLDTFYFHYNNETNIADFTDEFKKIGLNEDWVNPTAFRKKVERECRKYLLEPDKTYDPLAICFAVRIKIEENVFQMLAEEYQQEFLATHGTKEKLNYAQSKGACFPETYYLLGIIYNHPLHTAGIDDLSKPLSLKLDNGIIKNMIMQIFGKQ